MMQITRGRSTQKMMYNSIRTSSCLLMLDIGEFGSVNSTTTEKRAG
jgi:hypothetical protein